MRPQKAFDDMIQIAASSGAMALTGRRDGPPLTIGTGIIRAAQTAADTIAEHPDAPPLDGPRLLTHRAALMGLHRQAPWTAGGAGRAIRCTDGWLAVSLARETDVEAVPAIIQSAVVQDPWRALDRWAAAVPVKQALARTRLLEVPSAEVALRPLKDPGPAILAEHLPDIAPQQLGRQPVVVDMSSLWAGPLCAHLLSLSGFRIIKVETPQRHDGARRGSPAFYDTLHGGHESVEIDFSTREGLSGLRDLIRFADVVIEASRPRVLRDLGLTPLELLRGDGVWLSITAHGRTGPPATWTGFGDDVAAGSGAWVRDPCTAAPFPALDALADPLTGMSAAAAVLRARSTGGRWFLDAAMSRVVSSATASSPTPRARAAVLDGDRWSVRLSTGELVPVEPPHADMPTIRAPAAGRHTRAILAEVSRSLQAQP